jgi:SAM-dependent methyltransferase
VGFDADWLAARAPYDEAALDRPAITSIQEWTERLPDEYAPVVVDLGSGTGAALNRARRWLAPRRIVAYAVDQDAILLAQAVTPVGGSPVTPLVGDVLQPLDPLGGPPDGTVDLVVGHALADLLPLDRLAARVSALLRPGGLAHLALTYDGVTTFEPANDLDTSVLSAFHRHMDRPARTLRDFGGSTAGRRLGPALAAAGLTILVNAPSVWHVVATDGAGGESVLAGLLRFILEAAREVGGVDPGDLEVWALARQSAIARRALAAHVIHRDLLAGKLRSNHPR